MIACHDTDGRIVNIYHDPIPDGMAEHLTSSGIAHLVVDFTGGAVELSQNYWVSEGALCDRPPCPGAVTTTPTTIKVTGLPSGTAAILTLEPGTPLETSHALEEKAGSIEVDLDEQGPSRLTLSPPWPFMEAAYDLN